MVSGETNANVVEMLLYSVHLLDTPKYLANTCLCSVFWGRKTSYSEGLSTVAESALRDVGNSGGWGGRRKRDKVTSSLPPLQRR